MDTTKDIALMMADFGVAVSSGGYSTTGIFDIATRATDIGNEQGDILVADPSVVVRADSLPGIRVGSSITVAGEAYLVRDRLAASDGKVVRYFLRRT